MPPRKRRAKKTHLGGNLAEEQKQKLEAHLTELDLKVKRDLKLLDEMLKANISKIELAYRSAEMTLTKEVREMTVSEFKKLQGDMLNNGQNPLQILNDSVFEKVSCIVQKHSSAKKPSAASSKKKSAAPLNRNGMSSSLGKAMNEQQKRSGLRKGKKPLNSDSILVVSKQGASNNRPLKDDVFATPAPKKRKRTSQIITPKFDLRKPVLASRCRAPRPGETLVSLSGSPLQNPPTAAAHSEDCVVIGGKMVDLSQVVDKQKKNKLMNLQQKIAQLLS